MFSLPASMKIRSKMKALYSNFSDAQGQITVELLVVSGGNLNSFNLISYSSVPKEISKFSLMYMIGYFCRSVYYNVLSQTVIVDRPVYSP